MERILIKPDSKEIIFRGKPEDGHVDAFSYNYEGGTASDMGGLFIVGHVSPETEDTSYMVNLVASLAKREYYAAPSTGPKESFSKTLKKINEVLQDFFRNKDVKINIGIFAVAGENIFISRLGKFKIILSRDNQEIDILNNINLFSKEHIQEKEFSNIISGKIIPKDKIFAFYPGRSIIAREKQIKTYLTELGPDDFKEKLGEIRKDNENFLCSGIHVSINKYSEPAVVVLPQPRELKPKTLLAKISKARESIASMPEEIIGVRPAKKPADVPEPVVLPQEPMTSWAPKTEMVTNIDLNKGNVFYPGNKSVSESPSPLPPPLTNPAPEEQPLMRPSEFSTAKKENFLDAILKKYKPSGVYIIGQHPILTKKRVVLTVLGVGVFIGAAVAAKLTLLPSLPVPGIQSAAEKANQTFIDKVNSELKMAQGYKDQNDAFDARKTLIETLTSIAAANLNDQDVQKAKDKVIALLDQLDNAAAASPNLLYQISQDIGKGTVMTSAKDKLLVYVSDPKDPNSGNLLQTNESGIETTTKVANFSPTYVMGGQNLVVMINNLADHIASLTQQGVLKTASLSPSGSVINVYPSQGNLYILTSDGIYKIADADKGKSVITNWLNKNTGLPPQPALISVDTKVFVLTQTGSLVTYYRGSKQSEVNTSIPVNPNSDLLTNGNSTNLYLVDKNLGRIYAIDKNSGAVTKTIKLDNTQPFLSASISDAGIIYLLTADNKVWKVTP